MVISRKDIPINIELDNEKLEQVEEFKYLGVTVDRRGGHESERNKRIENRVKLYHSMNSALINKT